jgi:hypothetical protein
VAPAPCRALGIWLDRHCRRGESTDAIGRFKIGDGCTLEDPGDGKV